MFKLLKSYIIKSMIDKSLKNSVSLSLSLSLKLLLKEFFQAAYVGVNRRFFSF